MAVLCFVVDVARLRGAVLESIQQCLVQLANLAVLRSRRSTSSGIESIGLCTIKVEPDTRSYKLETICEVQSPFNFREFHYAAVSRLTAATISMDSVDGNGQVSSLSPLVLGEAFPWSPETATKRIIVISNCFSEPAGSFKQTVSEAASRCIMIDFIELDLADHTNDQCLYAQPKLTGEFHMEIAEFENCTLQRLHWNSATMSRLVKEWLQELDSDDGGLEAVLCFQSPLINDTGTVFCTLYPAVLHLNDVLKPCEVCRCHGVALVSPSQHKKMSCPITGVDLDERGTASDCLKFGNTILQMPSFNKTPLSRSKTNGAPISFQVLGSVYLALLSESLLFGSPYILVPSSEADIELNPGGDESANNDHIFVALCQELHSQDTGLLCTAITDIESGSETSFVCFYVLLPAQNSLLAKRLATSEEVLPFPPAMRSITSVPDHVQNSVSSSLSKMGAHSYDPLQYQRGCDAKLSTLLKESLQLRLSPRAVSNTRPVVVISTEDNNRPSTQFVTAAKVLSMEQQGTEAVNPSGRLRKNLHNIFPKQQAVAATTTQASTQTYKPSLPLNGLQQQQAASGKGRSRRKAT